MSEIQSCLDLKKKGKIMDGETLLPEVIIQHIQSFMSQKEAAQSTLLSKSWYNAWLTRPTIHLDEQDFGLNADEVFEEFAKKTMQRYQDLNLKIQSFRLLNPGSESRDAHDLVASAIDIGATDLRIDLPLFTALPQGVLGSKTLATLDAKGCQVNEDAVISCSSLKSLGLDAVAIPSNALKAIIKCCVSMEELSLTHCTGFALSLTNLYELHKLIRLYLHSIELDAMFFTDFASRFPCLKDLTIFGCRSYTRIQIASTSLETITFQPVSKSQNDATFEVPNIQKFTYSGSSLLSQLSIKVGSSREWELNLSLFYTTVDKSWYQDLKNILTKFRLSRISLSIYFLKKFEHDEVDIEVVPEPALVENLMIASGAPSSFDSILDHLFGICHPKFITQNRWASFGSSHTLFKILYNRLMHRVITPNRGIPNRDLFEKFGLKEVNMEVYDMNGTNQLPLLLKTPLDVTKPPENTQEVRFELIWGDFLY